MNGSIKNSDFNIEPIFGLKVPSSIDGVDSSVLSPRDAWINKFEYDKNASKLAKLFIENFSNYELDNYSLKSYGQNEILIEDESK